MTRSAFSPIGQRFSRSVQSVCIATALLGTTQFATAGQTVDQLSDCLVKATTATDKTTVLQWTFSALSAHPDLKAFSNITDQQRDQLDQKFAQVLQRVIVEQCATQTKAVIQAEGLQAVGDSFQELGRSTGENIIQNPEVKKQLQGVIRYVDLNKLVTTFLTPDIFNKLGITR
ncbi:hypothetical protein [uncultured Acinetobacter sp.]|uniref:hypothetical protein n=1 Tax=uncultured Acinetobacter sp. TaxID=165433 RepID=UPI0025E6AF1D|nr:hypothetical protein [uncultured Acinetobacter sp.]